MRPEFILPSLEEEGHITKMKTTSKKNKRTEDKGGETNGGDSYMAESNAVDDLPLAKSNDDQHLVESNKCEDGEQGKKKNKKSKKNKRTEDKEGETNGGDSYMSESNAVDDLPLTKSNDDQHLVESNKSEDGGKSKKKNKKKKPGEEIKDKEFKSNECEDDNQGKKIKKKQKLNDGNTLKECNDFRSNGDEDGKQDKKVKKKKKKLSEESKHKEFESSECEDDNQGKKMKKKQKLIEGNTLKECNDFRSNGDEDGKQDKKMKKKKKLSEENNHEEYNERNSNECEDDNQGKKLKKKQKLIEGNTLKECNDFRSNGGEDNEQDKKMKKKKKKKIKKSEESQHKEYNEFKINECEDDQGKKMKKKRKLMDGNTLNECNDFRSNGCEDGEQDTKKKKKQSEESKHHKESSKFKSNDGKPKRVTFSDEVETFCCDGDQDKKKKKKKKQSEESKHKESSEFKSNEGKPKRVTFSDEVEIFCCDSLVRGKRFTPEEDETLKESIFAYIDSHGLGKEGLDKILHAQSHREVRGCWKEIARALPHRSHQSVYQRGHALLENIGKCNWTPDELEFIRKSYEQHGPDWRLIADTLGKSRDQVKDAWHIVKYEKARFGHWSQEEYQTLFNLVNLDLRTRSLEPYRKTQHGMLRDNICWEAIGHKLETRNSAFCCKKWYEELTSPMVARGEWCDTDDFRMIDALYTLDACCVEEVDWDELLEHRSGDTCRKRWDQMVQHLGEHARKPFIEQVEVLTKRFCPDLLEEREAFDNKPVIC